MSERNVNRRTFLGLARSLVEDSTQHHPRSHQAQVPPGEAVVLDVMTPVSEYEGPYREIWNFFESTHPAIEINLFSIDEDTTAAHEAKIAGGYLPAIEHTQELQILEGADNFKTFVDLSTIDFPGFDKNTTHNSRYRSLRVNVGYERPYPRSWTSSNSVVADMP